MAGPLKLEVFASDSAAADPGPPMVPAQQMEEARLEAYEQGYCAGWEDAQTAQGEEQGRLNADILRSLEGMSFTYHEARGHVLRTLEPLMRTMADKILPDMAQRALGTLILGTLRPLAISMAQTPVTVALHPASRAALEPHLLSQDAPPFTIIEDQSLSLGQVRLCLGEVEQFVDMDSAVATIRSAVDDFFALEQKELAYG